MIVTVGEASRRHRLRQGHIGDNCVKWKHCLSDVYDVADQMGTVRGRIERVEINEINRTHKRALRTLYRDYESTFEELLDRGDTKTTHKKNLQNLMVEIYKSMNHLNPEYMWDFFVKKDVPYNLRTKELCKLPSVSSQRYGINSLSFRGSLLWNALSDDLKLATSLVEFKQEIRCWDGNICTCYICT